MSKSLAAPRACTLLMLLLPLLFACDHARRQLALNGASMGTTWHVKLDPRALAEERLAQGIQGTLDRIEARMSTYRPDSELTRFNRAHSREWFAVSAETARVVAEALRIARLTDGAFDISVGPLVELWGFGADFHADEVPAQDRIEAALAHTGYQKISVRVQPPALRKSDPLLQIDLSGIAKGYAVDAVAAYLDDAGIQDFMVEVGGEVRAQGHNPAGRDWRIAVEKPISRERAVERVISLRDQGMATSGDYRNYFVSGGVRYSHTIDPRTGWPVRHHPASATVVHDSTMTADGLATAMLVLGRKRGLALARREALAVLLIERDEQGLREFTSEAFRRLQRPERDMGE